MKNSTTCFVAKKKNALCQQWQTAIKPEQYTKRIVKTLAHMSTDQDQLHVEKPYNVRQPRSVRNAVNNQTHRPASIIGNDLLRVWSQLVGTHPVDLTVQCNSNAVRLVYVKSFSPTRSDGGGSSTKRYNSPSIFFKSETNLLEGLSYAARSVA
jgi:hypothetical protein